MNPGSSIHVASAAEDSALADKVIAALAPLARDAGATITRARGGDDYSTRKRYLVEADVIILVGTVRFFHDEFMTEVCLPWTVERHRAGDACGFFLNAKRCDLSEMARRLRVVPDDGRTLFAGPKGPQELFDAVKDALRFPKTPRICFDAMVDRDTVRELNELLWWVRLDHQPLSDRGRALQSVLDDRGGPRGGQFLSGGRFQLRRRWRSRKRTETWLAFDYITHREVMVHMIGAPETAKIVRHQVEVLSRLAQDELIRIVQPFRVEGPYSFFVTELVDGISLRDAVLRGAVEWHSSKSVLARLLGCILSLHERQLFHGSVDARCVVWLQSRESGQDGRFKLIFPLLHDAEEPDASAPEPEANAGESAEERLAADVRGWARLVILCGHGADLPAGLGADKMNDVISAMSCTNELKRVLVQCCTARRLTPRLATKAHDGYYRLVHGSHDELDVDMIEIAGGEFSMGSHKAEDGLAKRQEIPARRVAISTFYLSKFQVTQRLYRQLMNENPSSFPQVDDHPVNRVTWVKAIRFCNLLSRLKGFDEAYVVEGDRVLWQRRSNGFRLPTEAEWEYAARGTAGRRYPWGSEPATSQACWNGEGSSLGRGFRKGPSPVWSYPEGSTPEGVVGMVGNVWEWCWDWFAKYEPVTGILRDPIGPAAQVPLPESLPLHHPSINPRRPYRILKGGAWSTQDPAWMRAAARSPDDEAIEDPDAGFRLARGPHGFLDGSDIAS